MTLSQILKEYRAKNRISMRDFAKVVGISHQMIGVLESEKGGAERKKVTPSNATLKKLASAMGMTLEELIRAADDI